MKVVCRLVAGIAGVVLVALAMELVAPKAVHAVANLFVTVTNTPNVNVVNTPSVNVASLPVVTVSSLPAVTLGGTLSAAVSNPTDNNGNAVPLITENSGMIHSGFSESGSCNFGGTEFCVATVYTAPSNAYAIVQSVSGDCSMTATGDQLRYISLFANTDSNPVAALVPGPMVNAGSGPEQSFYQNITGVFFAPGGKVGVSLGVASGPEYGNCQLYVSGYTAQ